MDPIGFFDRTSVVEFVGTDLEGGNEVAVVGAGKEGVKEGRSWG